jgi:hypothetical protein
MLLTAVLLCSLQGGLFNYVIMTFFPILYEYLPILYEYLTILDSLHLVLTFEQPT